MYTSLTVIENRFPGIAAAFDAKVQAAFDATVPAYMAVADPLTPVRTGAMVSNKTVESTEDSRTITYNMFYTIYQDFGTRYITGKHFCEQGAAGAEPTFVAGMTAAVGVG